MGTVVFTPYGNTHIRIDQLIKKNLDEYDITSKTKKIRLYEGDTLYFIISLDNFEIKEVFFLMIKK